MGAFESIFKSLFGKKEINILMVGLDGAGKTTILHKSKLGEIVTTAPIAGFIVETVEYKNISCNAFDLGAPNEIHPIQRHYYQNTQGLIFVVDSNDREQITKANSKLWGLLQEGLRDAVFLIFANKQDLPNALTRDEVIEELGMEIFGNRNPNWHVQACNATTGEGLHEGLYWLLNKLEKAQIE